MRDPADSRIGYLFLLGVVGFLLLFPAAALFLPGISNGPPSAKGICSIHLHQIGRALQQYHAAFGSFPPARVLDAQGRPMHSWRVLLLPYLTGNSYAGMYRFDEPWDSPANAELLKFVPPWYQCPSSGHKDSAVTDYVAIVGPHAAFDASKSRSPGDFHDGPDNTILIVEIANSDIPWTEPRDLNFDETTFALNSGPHAISSEHWGGANVLFADGRMVKYENGTESKSQGTEFLRNGLTAAEVQSMLTIDGGEPAVQLPPR